MRVKVHTILSLKEAIGQREIEITLPEGNTVQDLLSWMGERWGDKLSPLLFSPKDGRPLPHIRLMVNGRSIEFLKGLETVLRDADELLILPMVTGG